MKKFSFVVPTYQNKRLVKSTLESLNHQRGYDWEDYEVILVDDGSTDGTEEYIRGVNKNYRLKYLYLERNSDSCCARARNMGWKEAEGEVVIFIDGDILVKEDYLYEIERCMDMAEDILVIGHVIMLREDTPCEMVCDREAFREKVCSITKSDQLADPRHLLFYKFSYNVEYQLYPWLQVFGANMAVRKKWLHATGGFDENFKKWGHEDIEMGYRMFKKGIKIVISSKLDVYHQYQRKYSKSNDYRNILIHSKANIDYFLEKHPNAIDAPREAIYGFFRGGYEIELAPEKKKFCRRTVLEFKNGEELEEIKQSIAALSKEEGNEIIIKDYVENSDLDIWVQLQGKTVSIPRYYPVSRIHGFKKIMGYRLAVFHLSFWYGCFVKRLRKIRHYRTNK